MKHEKLITHCHHSMGRKKHIQCMEQVHIWSLQKEESYLFMFTPHGSDTSIEQHGKGKLPQVMPILGGTMKLSLTSPTKPNAWMMHSFGLTQ